MREAFTYMFKDPGYEKKSIAYFFVCFLSLALLAIPELMGINATPLDSCATIAPVTNPFLLLLPILGLFFNCILQGYFYSCVKVVIDQKINIVLPLLNLWTSFKKGFKFYFALFLASMVMSLLFVPLSLTGFVGILMFWLVLIVCISVCGLAFCWLFAFEEKISTFFAWRKVFNIVKDNSKIYFKSWILIAAINFVGGLLSTLLMFLFNFLLSNMYMAWIATSIESAIIASYLAFVNMYLVAKAVDPITVDK